MSPIKIFFLYDSSDKFFFELFKELFIPEKVIIVNDNYRVHSEVSSSDKIIEKVDLFISLISRQMLHNITLLKLLLKNCKNSNKFIMLIIDELIYNTDQRIKIINDWNSKMKTFESQALHNDEAYNSYKTLEEAKSLLPKQLDSLCSSITTVSNKLAYLANELCDFVKNNLNTDAFLKYKEDIELNEFLYKKELEKGKNAMYFNSQTAEKINNYEIKADKVVMGDYKPTNDIDSIKSLIESIRQESSVLNSNDVAKLTCALDDINSSINNMNDINAKARLTNALNNISSLCTIASFAPTLHQYMQDLISKFSLLFP